MVFGRKMRKYIKKNHKLLDKEECELFLNAYYQGELPQKARKKLQETESELFLRTVDEEPVFQEKLRVMAPKKEAKKKKMVDGVLDLHGMYVEEAIQALGQFLKQEIRRGSKKLLVIHGKGGGVLRAAVWAFVESNSKIDDFQVATGKMGGEGALLIRVNQRRK